MLDAYLSLSTDAPAQVYGFIQIGTYVVVGLVLAAIHGVWHGSNRAAWGYVVYCAAGLVLLYLQPYDARQILSAVVSLVPTGILLSKEQRLWRARVELAWNQAPEALQLQRYDFQRQQAVAWCLSPLLLMGVGAGFGVHPVVGGLAGLPMTAIGIFLFVTSHVKLRALERRLP